MILADVNILIYAYREDSDRHSEYRDWLMNTVKSEQAFGLSELVLCGFLRIVTHPRIFTIPSQLTEAIKFIDALKEAPNSLVLAPGSRHFAIFTELCKRTNATGNLVSDAYLAALAIETGSTLVSTDRDFARFDTLDWRHPLAT